MTDIEQFWFISGGMRVKAFFVITGFLVSFSFISRYGDMKTYFLKRVMRIIPAYLCTILFCFVIGACMSSLPWQEFFALGQTWKYLITNLCMQNWFQPDLPGVFLSNFMTAVNGSLWSMKFEVLFYVLVPILFYIIAKYSKTRVLPIFVIGIIIINSVPCMPIQCRYFTYFFVGIVGLLVFTKFYKYIWYILLVSAGVVICVRFVDNVWVNRCFTALEPFLFGAILLGAAYSFTFLKIFRKCANITYGLYLYHFPVIQVLINIGLAKYNLWLCFVVALAITWILANLSWFFIEKPLIEKYK
ncbi:MAG: acyltransferase [Paludibacteraceae bacterium]|nr:acyltransferase [Paludibacteraceae bacterium]